MICVVDWVLLGWVLMVRCVLYCSLWIAVSSGGLIGTFKCWLSVFVL